MAPDNLASDNLASDNLAPDFLAPDNFALGQFGTNIIKRTICHQEKNRQFDNTISSIYL